MQLFVLFSPLIVTAVVALYLLPRFSDWPEVLRDDTRRYQLVRYAVIPAFVIPFLLYGLHLLVIWVLAYEYQLLRLYVHYLIGYHGIFIVGISVSAWFTARRLERGSADLVWHLVLFFGIAYTLTGSLDLIRIQGRWNGVVGVALPLLQTVSILLAVPLLAFGNRLALGVAVAYVLISALIPMWLEWLQPLPALIALFVVLVMVGSSLVQFGRANHGPR